MVPEGSCDVVIVGGGIAGLYTAWRLGTEHETNKWSRKSILLLEATYECGGRLRTIQHPALGYAANMGAMRYLPDQYLINGLVNEFSKELTPYKHDYKTAFWQLRARRMTFEPPAHLANLGKEKFNRDRVVSNRGAYLVELADEFGKEPGAIVELAIRKALRKISEDPATIATLSAKLGVVRAAELCEKLKSLDRSGTLRFSSLLPREWDLLRRYGHHEGAPLYLQSLWDLLHKNCSREAYHLVQDGLGYQGIVGLWNAAEAIVWFIREFESSSNYQTIDKGMQLLTDTLRQKANLQQVSSPASILNRSRGYCLGSIVETIDYDDSTGDFVLHIAHRPSSEGKSQPFKVTCRRVVLAMPAGALEKLKWGPGIATRTTKAAGGSEDVSARLEISNLRDSVKLVNRHPLLKFFIWFDRKWWREQKLEPGHELSNLSSSLRAELEALGEENLKELKASLKKRDSFVESDAFKVYTDSSLRQLYFYGGLRDRLSETPAEAIMMVYPDEGHASYWRSVARAYQGGKNSTEPSTAPEDDKDNRWYFYHRVLEQARPLSESQTESLKNIVLEYGVTPQFWKRVVEYLCDLFPGLLPEEISGHALFGALKDWMDPPFFAGWHSWSVGCEPWEIRRRIRAPFKGLRLYICGEAFSVEQGWSEGALRTAESILLDKEDGFGLAEPAFGGVEQMIKDRKLGGFSSIREYVDF